MFGRKAIQKSREEMARNGLVREILRLNDEAGNKPYIETLMLNNIVHRYYKNIGVE